MPGRIMENVNTNGSQTNYEKEKLMNGANGSFNGTTTSTDKGKGRSESDVAMANSIEKMTPNGSSDDFLRDATIRQTSGIEEVPRDMINQLPPELLHVSAGYLPLSRLLTRVSEHTHVAMENTILDLARLPLPSSAMNGNAARLTNAGDDNSHENINKKKKLLDFAQDTHTKFTKALVLTQWSQKSEDVSKVIDLRVHLIHQTALFGNMLSSLGELRRGLGSMRVRNPDLETAVEVLSTGKTSWMPDHGFIEPPPLTPKEILKTLKTLNSQLSLRIDLHEHEKLPVHFKNYTIKSGRVTFHVAGEFELDLTIADEDHQAQFWFIDFRFLFTPRINQIPEELLFHLENRINFILSQDDPFRGCYKFLHELVLTHKIAEIKRQAFEINRSKWVGTLVIEPLQRALCLQYWHGRHPGAKGPKSWIIIGVNSGKRKDGKPDIDAAPRIGIRWFRDAKEVKDVDIPIDLDRISTEALMKTVIGMHVEHILTCTYEKLKDIPLYKNRDLAVQLSISPTEPIESTIKLQVTHNETLTVAVEPITGRITLSPASPLSIKAEWTLNNKTTDPANEMFELLTNFRPSFVIQEIIRKCVSTGWENAPNPGIRMADLKGPVFRKDTQSVHWLKKAGWKSQWYVAVGISTSGEEWKLIETSGLKRPPPGPAKGRPAWDISTAKVSRMCSLPMIVVSPIPSYAFFGTLHIYAASQISHLIDVGTMHKAGIKYTMQDNMASVNATTIRMPRILVHLQGLVGMQENEPLQPSQQGGRKSSPWAKDIISFTFSGVESSRKRKVIESLPSTMPDPSSAIGTPNLNPAPGTPSVAPGPHVEETCVVTTQASVIVPSCKDLDLLGQHVDNDIRFHAATGTFTIKINTPFGQSSIPALSKRLRDVEQLVGFVKVMNANKAIYTCQSVSLSKIVFTYRADSSVADESGVLKTEEERALVSNPLTYRTTVNVGSSPNATPSIGFEAGNPHLRMEDIFNGSFRQYGLAPTLGAINVSLGFMMALDTLERSWCDFSREATLFVGIKDFWNSHLVYRIPDNTHVGRTKVVRIGTCLRSRGTKHMYQLKRVYNAGEDPSPDDIDECLNVVWNKLGNNANQPWKGLNNSAAAETYAIGNLISAIDNALKGYITRKAGSGKEKENKVVNVKQENRNQAPVPPTHRAADAKPQPPQRGIAPPALMTSAPSNTPPLAQRLAQIPEDQRKAYMLRVQTQAAQAQRLRAQQQQAQQQRQQHQQNHPQQRQPGATGQTQQRQGQEHEVITLDD